MGIGAELTVSGNRMRYAFGGGKEPGLLEVMGACHGLMKEAWVRIGREGAGYVAVLEAKSVGGEGIGGRFEAALEAERLRSDLRKKSGKFREAVITQALLVSPGVLESEDRVESEDALPDLKELEALDGGDFVDDPLDIAVPWEEKYGKKKEETQ